MTKIENYKTQIIKDYKKGKTLEEIGKLCNMSGVHVGRILKKFGIKTRTNKDYRSYTLHTNFFEKIDSHEKAAIFGFICADGYNNQSDGKLRIGIHKKDIDYLEKINKFIQPDKKDPIRFTYATKFRGVYKDDNRDIAYLVIFCQKICNDLANLGCGQRKSLTLRFPEIPLEFLPSFILGYFEGDGCITFHQRKENCKRGYFIRICCSDIFAKSLKQKIEENLDIHVGIIKNEKITDVYINGNGQTEKFMDWIYSKSSVTLNRKHEKYLEMKKYFKNY